jgi:hypothetical protein
LWGRDGGECPLMILDPGWGEWLRQERVLGGEGGGRREGKNRD